MTETLHETHAGGRREFAHESGAVVQLDQIEPQRGGLYALIRLYGKRGDRPIAWGRHNLMGSHTINTLIKGIPNTKNLPWRDVLSEALLQVVDDFQQGDSPVKLSDVETTGSTRWLIEPLVEEGGPTLLAAAGGSAKSYLGLAVATSVATNLPLVGGLAPAVTGPVLYLDWEADAEEHAYRFRRICAGADLSVDRVEVHYRRESQPLARSVHQLSRICDELGVVFIVVDSVMLARGGDAYGPEETINLFAGIREIGLPSLLADHKSREAIDKGRRGAYGSVVGENSARRVWEVRGTFDQPGLKTIRLENTKANNAARHDPIAFQFEWTDQPRAAVTIDQVPAEGLLPSRRSSDDIPLWKSIRSVLGDTDEPLGVDELTERLMMVGVKTSAGTVRKTLNRGADRFKNVSSAGNKGTWTLSKSDPTLFQGEVVY